MRSSGRIVSSPLDFWLDGHGAKTIFNFDEFCLMMSMINTVDLDPHVDPAEMW